MVAGRSPPSRWSCSRTLGTRRISASVGVMTAIVPDEDTCTTSQPGIRAGVSRADPFEHGGLGLGRAGADLDGALQGLQGPAEPGLVVGAQLQQGLPGGDLVAGLGPADDAGRGAHG